MGEILWFCGETLLLSVKLAQSKWKRLAGPGPSLDIVLIAGGTVVTMLRDHLSSTHCHQGPPPCLRHKAGEGLWGQTRPQNTADRGLRWQAQSGALL